VFVTSQGYCGVGPLGETSDENRVPTVRVGDKVAFIASTKPQIILRPLENGAYTFIDPEFVPFIEES